MKTPINKVILTAIIAVEMLWFSVPGESEERRSSWGVGISGTRVLPVNGPQLDVWFITEENEKLVGSCALANVASGSYKPVPFSIEGEWQQGIFWAATRSQVGNEAKGPWRTVSSQGSVPKKAKLVVGPEQVIRELKVSLEPFRGYIGKYQVGRVVLTSGASGIFELSNLRPPG